MRVKVVKAPRLKRDWEGRLVRNTRPLGNSLLDVPVGSIARIVYQGPRGSDLEFSACKCCGVRAKISQVKADSIEHVWYDPEVKPQSWKYIDFKGVRFDAEKFLLGMARENSKLALANELKLFDEGQIVERARVFLEKVKAVEEQGLVKLWEQTTRNYLLISGAYLEETDNA